ncbi:UDP-N-acetylmuramoyl-tripeptide--D-alanyl-D-alanine ligase [Roseicella frigidaeris]|uniref:UDP-N-acetylmuramoyl-tripeptide--D-alanyl-D-alanine ligase n=1 Tax=Roseicella frigidaeris TaxID=2230885 RepID=A0A327M7F6_9PROT|nr:UDP-N-acetylmuramoyl-tripeptide--D-alanyl-D-alanine ligase [Roseicella frigidaeris]RAI59241.1 UDP-N-acetylmuramoyl-tripeptide--D-alanyl-D-alanine ligase [Roseicella frigidaeris]
MSLWTAAALRQATGGSLGSALPVSGVSIDTRTLAPGDLFVALRDVRDGHDFVAEALARGAAAAMVDRDLPGLAPDAPLLRVADTLEGLRALGAAGRARCAGRIAAVTGSVGKTGTKEMLRLLLGSLGPTHAAVASYNNHWGVPLTLARMPAGTAFAVIEIGMNNPGEILPLSRLARPHVSAVTAIGEAHIGHMGGLEAVAEEKGSIAAGLEPGGVAVLPRDSAFFDRLAALARAAGAARVIGFGEHPAAEVRLAEAGILRDGRTRALVALGGGRVEVIMPAMGLHHAANACCALAVVQALGLDARRVAPALAAYAPGAGRGAPREIAVPGGTALLIDESYNAAPPAMRAALRTLALRPGGRRIAVLGDMRELGEFSAALHAGLAPEAGKADLVFCCGPEMARLYALLPPARRGAHAADSAALAPIVREALRPDDVVLVKGALGSRMALVVRALTELPT